FQSESFKATLRKLVGTNEAGEVSINFNTSARVLSLTHQSQDPQFAFDSVNAYTNVLNSTYKIYQLNNVNVAVQSTQGLLDSGVTGKLKEALVEKYALQLYKKAILENKHSELIQVTTPPVKPVSHIKPKRPLIIVSGIVLGAIFGVMIILLRNTFRQEGH
ncbi:MAG: hypothetical protein GY776_17925, partial [Alteromonas sp.]|nr:hypothetical protein [Alteromonas sp.]